MTRSVMPISNGLSVKLQFFSSEKMGKLEKMHEKLVSRYGKAKALSIIAQKFACTVYSMLKRKEPFEHSKFFQNGTIAPHS